MAYNEIKDLRIWVQKILPLVYDDSLSYYEVLAKVTKKLNEMVTNINELPELVNEAVLREVDHEHLVAIISEVLSEGFWVNVKFPPTGITPAKGDGSTDDTASIKACVDYAIEHNMALFFPNGEYKITETIEFDSESSNYIGVLGVGKSSSVISTTASPAFVFNNGCYSVHDLGFVSDGLTIENSPLVAFNTCGISSFTDSMILYPSTGVVISACEKITLSNIDVHGAKHYGIWVGNSYDIHGSDITIVETVGNTVAPLSFDTSNDCYFDNVIFNEVGFTGGDVEINSGCERVYVKFMSSKSAEPFYVNDGTTCECEVVFYDYAWTTPLSDEATTREDADTALGGRIDDEIEDREDADTALGGRIDDEIEDREDADTALGGRIDDEIRDRGNADTALGGRIDDLIIDEGLLAGRVTAVENSVTDIINNRIYNVKDFGAVGDGVTDDTQAIIDCLAKVSSTKTDGDHANTYVIFPAGQYVISGGINIPYQCSIEGTMPLYGVNPSTQEATAGTWLYIKDNTTPPSYDYNSTNTFPDTYATIKMSGGCAIRNIGFFYPDQATANMSSTVIPYRWTVMMSGPNNEMTNVFASNPYKFLLLQPAHSRARIHRIFSCPLNEGIRNVRSTDIDKISDVHFHNSFYGWGLPNGEGSPQEWFRNYRKDNLIAITLMGCDWMDVTDVFVHTAKYALQLVHRENPSGSISYSGCRHSRFTRIKCENVVNGVLDYVPSDMASSYDSSNGNRDIGFTDCVFVADGYSVRFALCRGLFFEGCSFTSETHAAYINGIGTNTLVTDVSFTNCYFIQHSLAGTETDEGAVVSAAKHTMVSNCFFRDGRTANSHVKGIRLMAPAVSAVIINNSFRNYSGECLFISSGNTSVTTVYFTMNMFETCTANYASLGTNTVIGIIQMDDDKIRYLDGTTSMRFMLGNNPTHKTGTLELFADSTGKLCYLASDGTKRTISYA